MTLRITLLEEGRSHARAIACGSDSPRPDCEGPQVPAMRGCEEPMLLYYPDEPTVGTRFRYADVEWEVVDYDDGWVARLVVEHARS